MTSFSLYGHDMQSVSVNAGFVAASGQSIDPDQTAFLIRHNNITIAFNTQANPNIGDGDLLVNSWVLDFLNLQPSDTITVEPVVLGQMSGCMVELTFVAYQSQVNWDELPRTGPLRIPYMWSKAWPESYKQSVLERNASILLQGAVLHQGSLIGMKVLDSLMVFRVSLSAAETDSISPVAVLASPHCTYRISLAPALSKTTPTPTEEASLSSAHLTRAPLCFAPTVRNVMHLCEGVFGSDARPGGFVKSVLLSAPAGGGKSVLLDTVASLCAEAHEGVTVLRASCQGLDQRADNLINNEADKIDTSEWDHLLQVLRALGMDHLVTKSQSMQTDSVFLCLDDMDAVFMHYSARKDDNLETGRTAEIYQQFGYQLSQLLRTLAQPNNSTRILVVGCTRKDPTQLLRAHTGCPEFEKCFALCSPTYTERVHILNKILTDTGLIFQMNSDTNLIDLEREPGAPSAEVQHAVRGDWAARLAALSAGYLPGDLAAVVQRIVFLHRGKSVAMQSKMVSGESVVKTEREEKVSWNTALDAIVSVIPLTLQQLGVQGNSNNNTSSSARLSWRDFAGYTDIVNDLKRRLAPLANSTSSGGPSTGKNTDYSNATMEGAPQGKVLRLKGAVLRGIVLHGPSGCGKTLLASVITSELKMNFVSVRSTDLLSRYFGETESKIRDLFHRARAAAPCVLFFDDFDTLAHKRSAADASDSSTSSGLHGRILSTFLNELDGIVSSGSNNNDNIESEDDQGKEKGSQQVLVIAACQDIANLDEALVRPGRLQHHVLLHQPNAEDIASILTLYASKLNCAADLSLVQASATLCELRATASEVESFARHAFMHAIRQKVHALEQAAAQENALSDQSSVTDRDNKVTQEHFDLALKDLLGERYNNNHDESVEVSGNESIAIAAVDKVELPSFEWSGGFSFGV